MGGRFWRIDPSIVQANACASAKPVLFDFDSKTTARSDLRELFLDCMDIRSRILACSRGSEGVFGLAMLRSSERGPFSAEERARVGLLIDILFPMLRKHWEIRSLRRRLSNALKSLVGIEQCIALAPEGFPRREAQVGARILYGLSTPAIASDLDISCETVITYRKRVYERLSINSQHELLVWYLTLYENVACVPLSWD
jgi:DNA-binding CsgD family transcriptional regulator